MKRKRFSVEQIVPVLKQAEKGLRGSLNRRPTVPSGRCIGTQLSTQS